MIITSEQKIAGIPAIKLRDFFRRFRVGSIRPDYVSEFLGVGSRKAKQILIQLENEGYLQSKKVRMGGKPETWWKQTTKGLAFAMASVARPIKRATAEKLLSEFLERVEEVNRSPKFLYWIEEVILFRSYLDEARQTLGDIDLAIRLERKEENVDKHMEMVFSQVEEDGRDYESYFFQINYGYYKVKNTCAIGQRRLVCITRKTRF